VHGQAELTVTCGRVSSFDRRAGCRHLLVLLAEGGFRGVPVRLLHVLGGHAVGVQVVVVPRGHQLHQVVEKRRVRLGRGVSSGCCAMASSRVEPWTAWRTHGNFRRWYVLGSCTGLLFIPLFIPNSVLIAQGL
jgi:hypothetical protein